MVLKVSGQVVYEAIEGEAVLLDLGSGHYFQLNEEATRAFELIDDTGDLGAVEGQMASEYDVDRAVLATDLTKLVDELITRGLLDRTDRPA